ARSNSFAGNASLCAVERAASLRKLYFSATPRIWKEAARNHHSREAGAEMAPEQITEANSDVDPAETREWLDSLEGVLQTEGPERARFLLSELKAKAAHQGVTIPFTANTPYINTIPREKQMPFPGNREIERRIKSIIRWNAMAMVVRANKR